MKKKLTKRRKNVRLAWIIGVLLVIIFGAFFWIKTKSGETYKPGEEIEGLTSELAREIPEGYPNVKFVDVTTDANIIFTHFNSIRTTQLPEDMGSGAAWGDFDNDGWQDLFVANFAGALNQTYTHNDSTNMRCVLYHNEGDGTFKELSNSVGIDLIAFANGAAWMDYDNDGWLDLAVSCYGRNKLFKNSGKGTFIDVSDVSGVGKENGFWTGITWGDYNKDGFADLYICGYVDYVKYETGNISRQYNADVPSSLNPSSFKPIGNLLFKNNGNGTFSDVTEKASVANEQGRSLSAAWCDFDQDGWQDLYVANDVSDNVLYRNLGNGTFEEISHGAFVADYRGAMGIAIGDWNNDEDMDMFITHWIAQENALYNNTMSQMRSLGNDDLLKLKFMDEADRYGLGQIAIDYVGFGTLFLDYDNDGRLDLFVTNGSTFEIRDNSKLLVPMKDQLFWNKSNDKGFFDISSVSGPYFQEEHVGRGAATSDYDNDGDQDIFIVNNNGKAVLLRNDSQSENHWLQVKLLPGKDHSCLLGTKIKLITKNDNQIRELGTEGSYLSQNSLVQHFGLGNQDKVDTLKITWPDGHHQIMTDVKSNQLIKIKNDINQ